MKHVRHATQNTRKNTMTTQVKTQDKHTKNNYMKNAQEQRNKNIRHTR